MIMDLFIMTLGEKNPRNKNGGNLELFTFSDFSKNNKKRMLVISDKD